jgi:hypothetical protein
MVNHRTCLVAPEHPPPCLAVEIRQRIETHLFVRDFYANHVVAHNELCQVRIDKNGGAKVATGARLEDLTRFEMIVLDILSAALRNVISGFRVIVEHVVRTEVGKAGFAIGGKRPCVSLRVVNALGDTIGTTKPLNPNSTSSCRFDCFNCRTCWRKEIPTIEPPRCPERAGTDHHRFHCWSASHPA